MLWYQHLIYVNQRASDASPHNARTPQIWPHFAAFVLHSLLRSVTTAILLIHAGNGDAFSGWMASAVKNVM